MFRSTLRIGVFALAAVVAAHALANSTASQTDLSCGINATTERGMLVIEAIVQNPTAITGQYRLALKSQGAGGSSNISQGGQFSAAPGVALTLGRMVVNAGADLDIDFTVTADGKQIDCSAPLALTS